MWYTHWHWCPLWRDVLQGDQRVITADYKENVKYTYFSSLSWTSDSYFFSTFFDQAWSKVNTKSHSWSSTAWTWIEVVCCLIQSFWMCGISCEQRNKHTKKVVENCRFSRISEMIYSRAGCRMANRCEGFFWPSFPELAESLPTRGLDSHCSLSSHFVWTFRILRVYIWKDLFH